MTFPLEPINTCSEIDRNLQKIDECISKQQEILRQQIAILSQILTLPK